MEFNNDDVAHVELTAEEKAVVENKPTEGAKSETAKPDEVRKEEGKEEVKAEAPKTEKADVQETKEPEVEPPKFEDVFKLKDKEKPKKEVKPLTDDERAEFEKLKLERQIETEKNALKEAMKHYTKEQADLLEPTISKFIDVPAEGKEADDFYGQLMQTKLTPEMRAYIVTALAEKANAQKLLELAKKSISDKVEAVKTNAKTVKEIKEIATLDKDGNTSVSPKDTRKELMKRAKNGDESALNDLLLSDEEKSLFK